MLQLARVDAFGDESANRMACEILRAKFARVFARLGCKKLVEAAGRIVGAAVVAIVTGAYERWRQRRFVEVR